MKKVLLVTGASSDIGRSYISEYANRYDKIVGTYYTSRDCLEELQKDLGDKLETYPLNLLDEDAVDRFGDFLTEQELLPGYMLHLPAQKTDMIRASELDSRQIRSDLEISTVSFLRLLRPILSDMTQKQFGRICCMLSSVTENAVAFMSSYTISKYALLGAVKALAAEYAGKRITVNAVSPSMVDTKFVADKPAFVKKKRLEMVPIKRLAVPEDVTRAMAFLLEDGNEYITGENFLIAGGSIIS